MAAVYCVEVAICAESVHQGEQVAAHYGIKYVYTSSIGFAARTTRPSAWRPSNPAPRP